MAWCRIHGAEVIPTKRAGRGTETKYAIRCRVTGAREKSVNRIHVSRVAFLGMTATIALGLGGCAADEGPLVQETTAVLTDDVAEPSRGEGSDTPTQGDGDHAFGAERGDMVRAIEKACESDEASARWEGDVLILSMQGDAEGVWLDTCSVGPSPHCSMRATVPSSNSPMAASNAARWLPTTDVVVARDDLAIVVAILNP